MNNTQSDRSAHHDVMYRVIYSKLMIMWLTVLKSASANLILKFTNTWNIFINAVNQKIYEDFFSIFKEMYERNFHWENLTVQLGQFATFLDTSNISVTKVSESLVNFGKNQKMLLSKVTLSKRTWLKLPRNS